MNNIIQRIAREPVAIAGLITALYGVLVAFDILVLTATQYGSIAGVGGAIIFFLRWLVTPSNEVIVQQKPGEVPKATEASDLETNEAVEVLPIEPPRF